MSSPKMKKFKLADLDPAPYNPREIGETAFDGLRASLAELGLLEVPVVNVKGGKRRIVHGHQRVNGLIAEGFEYADCIVVEFDPLKEKQANLLMNSPHIRGQWDISRALPDLGKMRIPTADPLRLGALQTLLLKGAKSPKAPKSPKKKKKLPLLSKEGGVYGLGEHVLLCGSFLDEDNRDCLSDWFPVNACVAELPSDELLEILQGLRDVVEGPCYLSVANGDMSPLHRAWNEVKGRACGWLVAPYQKSVDQGTDFSQQYELILYGVTQGTHEPRTSSTNVMPVSRTVVDRLHPRQRSLNLVKRLVDDGSDEGHTVLDPFACAGDTLLACQELGRVCIAFAADPADCDLIRKRWSDAIHGVDSEWESLTPEISE